MWMDGAVGVAEVFSRGERHGDLTFCSHSHAEQSPFAEADVRRITAHIARELPPEGPARVGQSAQQPVKGVAAQPPAVGPALPVRPNMKALPWSGDPERQQTTHSTALSRLPERRSGDYATRSGLRG